MALTREDLLRELELLPVWRQRSPAPVQAEKGVPPEATEAVETAQTVMAEPSQQKSTRPSALSEAMSEAPQADQTEVTSPVTPDSPALIPITWALLYQVDETQAAAAATLMTNIANAMRLASDQHVVLTDVSALAGYQADKLVIFGEAVGAALIGNAWQSIQAARGQAAQHLSLPGTQIWLTDAVEAMLSNPANKAQVWRDLQAAMR